MKIEKDTVVLFHYRLKDTDDRELESSEGQEPVAYLHGHGVMVPGIESELTGHSAGESLSVTLEQPYGPYKENSVMRVPIKHLISKQKPVAGRTVTVNTQSGPREVLVLKVGRFNIDVDTNHPYAGKTLTYDLDIKEVRVATAEEIAHGHAHGPGGHQH